MQRDKGRHAARVLSAGGEIEVLRRYFWSQDHGGTYPADAAIGIAASRVTAGACEICCRMGMTQDFGQGAEDARRIGGVLVSKERLRQIVEGAALAITQARQDGQVAAAWTAEQVTPSPQGPRRVYAGVDGVLVRTVTQTEKDKRRAQHVTRRRQRAARGVNNIRPLPPARAGSDQTFKEMKIGVFYDQEKQRRHAFATAQTHATFGPLLAAFAAQIGWDQADERLSLTDGAKWIATQINRHLPRCSAMLLDFFHLSQHVHAAAQACLGDTPAARAWALARLEELKTVGFRPVLDALATLRKACRAAAKRKSLDALRNYIVERNDMVDYPTALAHGWDIGSGPTEAMCKTLTLRLKRPGMKWDRPHAAAMMNLTALYESGQAPAYWASRRAA